MDLEGSGAIVKTVCQGMRYAQVDSDNPRANGGMRGLPRHERYNDYIHAWDTQHAIMFLNKVYSRTLMLDRMNR